MGTSFLNSHLPIYLSKKLENYSMNFLTVWQGTAQKTRLLKDGENLPRR